MPFTLIIIGIVLLIATVRGTNGDLFALVKGDFTGPNNFIYWMIAILLIGALGYIPKVKAVSVTFMVLIVLVLFLSRGNTAGTGGGFFQQFVSAIQSTQTASPTAGGNSNSPLPGLSLPDLASVLAVPLTIGL